MKAIWNGTTIASSDDTVVVERNHYFPAAALDPKFIAPSSHRSHCHWKGEAHYYDLKVAGETNPKAVWYYPEPFPAAAQIKDRIAFWKGVKVVE